jgi:hypothetical protein
LVLFAFIRGIKIPPNFKFIKRRREVLFSGKVLISDLNEYCDPSHGAWTTSKTDIIQLSKSKMPPPKGNPKATA